VSKKRPRGVRRPVENKAKLDEIELLAGKETGQRQNHPVQSGHTAAVTDFLPASTVKKLQALAGTTIVR
jgi:hypothetical protein